MKFNKEKYPVLTDIEQNAVLFSNGLIQVFSSLDIDSDEEISFSRSFNDFCEKVILDCKKGYYLSKNINDTIINDFKLQEKLSDLLHELQPTDGVILFPQNQTQFGPLLNSVSYSISKPIDKTSVLFFAISIHSINGIEIFRQGEFIGKRYKSKSLISSDLNFNGDKDETLDLLTNYVLNVILFMQFAEIETVIIDGSATKGRRKVKLNNEQHLNETSFPIEIIDSKWFRKLVRIGAFKVEGHFRLQPHGINNSLRKLIWISEYQKRGYMSSPKIERYTS